MSDERPPAKAGGLHPIGGALLPPPEGGGLLSDEFSALLCGVGGQGLVLLSNIIGRAGALSDIRVMTGEQHGLSQRSGSISVHLRVGNDILSPLIPLGCADALLSLEAMEALRYIEYLRDGGVVVASRRIMRPVTETGALVKDRDRKYLGLDEITARLGQVTSSVFLIDALELAARAANPLTENVVMLGALCVLEKFPIEPRYLRTAIENSVPPGAAVANLKAFELGMNAAKERFCKDVACRGL